jgi:hypothetical protein
VWQVAILTFCRLPPVGSVKVKLIRSCSGSLSFTITWVVLKGGLCPFCTSGNSILENNNAKKESEQRSLVGGKSKNSKLVENKSEDSRRSAKTLLLLVMIGGF